MHSSIVAYAIIVERTSAGGRYAQPVAPTARRIPPERLAVWREFLEVHALVVGELEAELDAARELPLAWYDVLVSLSEAPERRLRMQDLADRVLFSRSGLTRLVDRMAAAGYVERVRCEDDRRGTFALLTAVGAACLRDASGVHLRGVAEHFDRHLSDTDVRGLHHAMRKILDGEGDR
jgi:DNA-binding MarR family transcriptional regulator